MNTMSEKNNSPKNNESTQNNELAQNEEVTQNKEIIKDKENTEDKVIAQNEVEEEDLSLYECSEDCVSMDETVVGDIRVENPLESVKSCVLWLYYSWCWHGFLGKPCALC